MIMRLRRSPKLTPAGSTPPTPDYLAIAVMEYEELGIRPEPGSAAAGLVALRSIAAEDCEHLDVVDVTTFGQRGHVGLCTRCGTNMIQDGSGEWEQA